MRASDADRERTVAVLREHAGAGRLEPAELEDRVGRALSAATVEELAALTADLPGPAPAGAARRRSRTWRAVRGPVAVTLLLVGIWAASGAGYFWPVWPMIGMAFWAWAELGGGCGHRRRACGPKHRHHHRQERSGRDEVWV